MYTAQSTPNRFSLVCLTGLITLGLFALNIVPAQAKEASFGPDPSVLNARDRCIIRLSDDLPKADVPGRARGMLARANAMNRSAAKLNHVYQHSIKDLRFQCHVKRQPRPLVATLWFRVLVLTA